MCKSNQKVKFNLLKEKQLEEASKATNHLGRYVTDLNAEDEKKMAIWEQKMLEPYLEVYKQVDWDEYTFEKMNERYRRECVSLI